MQRFISTALLLSISPMTFAPGAGAMLPLQESALVPSAVGTLGAERSPKPTFASDLRIALKRTVTPEVAERGFTVQVSYGIGLVLNLSGLGEGIAKVWLSDPSRLVYSSQGSVIYLKPIQALSFPGNYHAADGSTLLSVVTQSGKVYQFNIAITSGKAAYTSLDIAPGSSPYPSRYPSTLTNRPRSNRNFTARLPQTRRFTESPKIVPSGMPQQSASKGAIAPHQESAPQTSNSTWKAVRPFIPPTAPTLQAQNPPVPVNLTAPVHPPESATQPTIQSSSKPATPLVEPQPTAKVPDPSPKIALQPQPQVSKPDSVLTRLFTADAPPTTPEPASVPEAKTEPEPPNSTPPVAKASPRVAAAPSTVLANAIARGLPVAIRKKMIRSHSNTYNKVESAIGLLRTRKVASIPDAAKHTGLTVALLNRIEGLGHRPELSPVPPQAETPNSVPASAPATPLYQSQTKPFAPPSTADEQPKGEPVATVAIASPVTQTPAALANAIARGLPLAIHNKRIRRYSSIYDSVQSAIGLLRRGQVKTLPDAAKRTGLKIALLDQLHAWGTQQ